MTRTHRDRRRHLPELGSVLGMPDGPDVSTALRGGVRTRLQAWEFVRWYADTWMDRPLRPEDGCTTEELADAEGDLGFELPAVLSEGYALFGRRDDLTRQQDPLVRPAGLYVDDALDGVLVFRRENQDCASWGIPLARIGQGDPPVVVESHRGWIPFLDRMSLAWVELVLSESQWKAPTEAGCGVRGSMAGPELVIHDGDEIVMTYGKVYFG